MACGALKVFPGDRAITFELKRMFVREEYVITSYSIHYTKLYEEELAHTAKGIVAQAGWGRFITRSEQ